MKKLSFSFVAFINVRSRIVKIDRLILTNVNQEYFMSILQTTGEIRVFPVPAVSSYPGEKDSVPSGLTNHVKGLFALGLKDDIIRYTRLFAASLVVSPLLGRIKSGVNQTHSSALRQGGKNAHLTIIDLARSTAPLSSYTNRFFPLFRNAAFVNEEGRILMPSQKSITIFRNLIKNWSMISGRIGDKMLQGLLIAIRNNFGHTFHIFTAGLNQTFEILLGCLNHGSSFSKKKREKTSLKQQKSMSSLLHWVLLMTTTPFFNILVIMGFALAVPS